MSSDNVSNMLGVISTDLLIAEVLINFQDLYITWNEFIAVASVPYIFFRLQFFKNSLMSLAPFLVSALNFIGWIGFTIAFFFAFSVTVYFI